jgi:epoxyqueuosine reductase
MDPAIPIGEIAARAISLGASLVGAAPVQALLRSPSHRLDPVDRRWRVAESVLVLALAHTDGQPEMDWWDNRRGRTPGNRLLIETGRGMIHWMGKAYGAEAREMPYQARRGGVFLKDAAVLAGLGAMGKNNLLITPGYGPRVRLRALLLNRPVQGTGPLADFAPCDGCDGPCLRACPRDAFHGGAYRIDQCRLQMRKNEIDKIVIRMPVIGMPAKSKTAYCRECELSCPVGTEIARPGGSPQA